MSSFAYFGLKGTKDQILLAFDMVFKMIVEDPQSGSCPNVSYMDFKGPIANANPTGSPFAGGLDPGFPVGNSPFAGGRHVNAHSVEALKSTLRGNGYSIQASDEITAALCTLNSYGLLGFGNSSLGSLGALPATVGMLSLDHLSSILNGNRGSDGMSRDMGPGSSGGMFNQFMGGPDKSFDRNYGNSSAQDGGASDAPLSFNSNFGNFGGNGTNSFGMGSSLGGFPNSSTGHDQSNVTKELQVAENVVGAVIGPGGRAIVEMQKLTSATLQISKKGAFAPGTRNRIVTISGTASAVERAVFMVQQCIQQEESKRSRQEQLLK